MTDVADVVSPGAEGGEEFDGPHHCHVRTHRDCDWKGNQPDAAVREEQCVCHKNAENSTRGTNGRSYRRQASKENWNRFDEKLDESRAHPADAEIIQKLALPPNKFQVAAEHPEHEHIDEQVEKAAVHENISEGLPDPGRDVMGYGFRDQRKPLEQPDGGGGRSEQADKSLQKKNARANQYQEFYAWGNETTPVE